MANSPTVCERHCEGTNVFKKTRLIVITGGPGAGKTALLEMAKKVLCDNVVILPEAASIVFGGGFWRMQSASAKRSAQSAIFHVQAAMEKLVIGEQKWAVGLCDRGTLDGLAYWPSGEDTFWKMSKTEAMDEYRKYFAVIHLRSPNDLFGYNHVNPLRVETAVQAGEIDEKIAHAWAGHGNYHVIESAENFLTKTDSAMKLIAEFVPKCCQEAVKLDSEG